MSHFLHYDTNLIGYVLIRIRLWFVIRSGSQIYASFELLSQLNMALYSHLMSQSTYLLTVILTHVKISALLFRYKSIIAVVFQPLHVPMCFIRRIAWAVLHRTRSSFKTFHFRSPLAH